MVDGFRALLRIDDLIRKGKKQTLSSDEIIELQELHYNMFGIYLSDVEIKLLS